jgi:hypothetical protein
MPVFPMTPTPRIAQQPTSGKTIYNTTAIQKAVQFLQDENYNKGFIYDVDVDKEGLGKAFVRYGNGSVDVRPFRVIANGLVSYYGKTARLERFGNGLKFS